MPYSSNLWLIGLGLMAQSYAAVLKAQSVDFTVIGRGDTSAEVFEQATGLPVFRGGLEKALAELPSPQQAIVAVGVELLAPLAQQLITAGCRRLLLEKPGALYPKQLKELYALAKARNTRVWIAYNRRFFHP